MFEDIRAIFRNDPACKNIEFLLYPSLQAITAHRYIIHPLYKLGLPFFPRMLSQIMRFLTGIEIHPGARIGKGFFCDHGAGVVIGETVEMGNRCVLFHGVTLGGTGKQTGKRHPTLGDDVFVGAHATLLGPIHVGDRVRIGAKAVIINRDVPPDCTVVGSPGFIVKQNGKRVEKPLPVSVYHLRDREAEGNPPEDKGFIDRSGDAPRLHYPS
ncbi:MAG: serine O-acetyltransferase [Acidobacteriota bacterium]|jgi:serine O-acetyltransferase